MKVIRINEPHLWELRFICFGLVVSIANKKATFYGKGQGWNFDCCLRKNTIY